MVPGTVPCSFAVDSESRICKNTCVFRIELSADVENDLKRIPRYYRKSILDEIEAQLSHEPTVPTRNRKVLVNLAPPWDVVSVVWELRIGEYRVFYDVAEAEQRVSIRAIRRKPHGKTTKEIL